MKVIIENAALHLADKVREAQAAAIATIAQVAVTRLNKDKPPEPLPGSMQWVSDKQERFVKKMFAMKRMTKYRRGRGNGLPWQTSQRLNRSYVVLRMQIGDASVVSTASYARYVVGDEQSQLHQGRWKTGAMIADEMQQDGVIDKIIADAVKKAFTPTSE